LWERDEEPGTVHRGISLWYFGYFLLGRLESQPKTEELLRAVHLNPEGGVEKLASELMQAARNL